MGGLYGVQLREAFSWASQWVSVSLHRERRLNTSTL